MKKLNSFHVAGAVALAIYGGVAISHASSGGTKVPAHMKAPIAGVIDMGATKEKLCTPGYTATIRPPASYTTALKIKQLQQWNYKDQKTSDYEEDHFIPLELGGHPTDPGNLFPEPWAEAHVKDREENRLHAAICSGQMTIVQAQWQIRMDWK